MTLQEALKIGSMADGYIKCTYAMLYDQAHGRLFSLQHLDTISNTAKEDWKQSIGYHDPATFQADATIYFKDIPVVTVTDSQDPKEKFIPVKLTEKACEIINEKIAYKRISVSPDSTLFVKSVAIDWIPANIANAKIEIEQNGHLVELTNDLARLKAKYDRAKAIFAGATTFAII